MKRPSSIYLLAGASIVLISLVMFGLKQIQANNVSVLVGIGSFIVLISFLFPHESQKGIMGKNDEFSK